MSSAPYLQPLVAPLRFLAQSDFARLSTVKGLEGLVRTALEGARAARSGADVQLLERVARALERGGPETAQEALRALAPRVRDAGATAGPPPATPAPPRQTTSGANLARAEARLRTAPEQRTDGSPGSSTSAAGVARPASRASSAIRPSPPGPGVKSGRTSSGPPSSV